MIFKIKIEYILLLTGIFLLFLASNLNLFVDFSGQSYLKNECFGKNDTNLDSEGWSDMDFCVKESISNDLVLPFIISLMGILAILIVFFNFLYFFINRVVRHTYDTLS